MKIFFRTYARNCNSCGQAKVDAETVFNFDGFREELSSEALEFLSTCSRASWTRIPSFLLDPTTDENFRCYVKLL